MAKRYDSVTIICDECGRATSAPLDHNHAEASDKLAWISAAPEGWRVTADKDFCAECETKLQAES